MKGTYGGKETKARFYVADVNGRAIYDLPTSWLMRHAPKKCPIYITNDIKKELEEMVSLRVIQPLTEPNDWVSSVAYSQKSSERWRIYLDPKDLNRALKKSHHHKSALEEITNSKAQYFQSWMPAMVTCLWCWRVLLPYNHQQPVWEILIYPSFF